MLRLLQRRAIRAETVQNVAGAGLCMGCGACKAVCPRSCVSLGIHPRKGTLEPRIVEDRCLPACDLCLRVCPGREVDIPSLSNKYVGDPETPDLLGIVRSSCVVHAQDPSLRFQASSGGAVTALLIHLLQTSTVDGVLCIRMSEVAPDRAEVIIARSSAEVLDGKGSKYCPSPLASGLEKVMQNEGRYAVVGLPCHVHAIRKFQDALPRYRDRIAVVIGLFCGGCPTQHGTDFLLRQLDIDHNELRSLQFRGQGWPGVIRAVVANGDSKEMRRLANAASLHERAVNLAWMHRYFYPLRCLTCPDLTARLADLSFGDPWLDRYVRHEKEGLSLVLARSASGERFLEQAVSGGAIVRGEDLAREEVIRSQGKLKKKAMLKTYRKAAALHGLEGPVYGGLYEERNGTITYLFAAWWEFSRLRLGRHRWLWPLLLRSQIAALYIGRIRGMWRGRIRRLAQRLAGSRP